MMISTLPVLAMAPETPAAAPSGEAVAAGLAGLFELLLPAGAESDPTAILAGIEGGMEDAKNVEQMVPNLEWDADSTSDQDAETEPAITLNLAEQTNLAALLYTLPASPAAAAPLIPVGAATGIEAGESIAEMPGEQRSAEPETQAVTERVLESPAAGVLMSPSPKDGKRRPWLPAESEARQIPGPVATRLSPKMPGPESKPVRVELVSESTEEPMTSTPGAKVVTEETKPGLPEAAKFAVPQKAAAVSPEWPPAKSSPMRAMDPVEKTVSLISETPVKADVSLVSEPTADAKKARGTAGAKPIRDMIEVPAMNQIANPDQPATRPVRLGASVAEGSIDEQWPERVPSDAQQALATRRQETIRGSSEPFSLTTPMISTPFARPLEVHGTSVAAEAPKPMAPAAVIDHVGLGLESIRQHGHDRVDLRLSLEGGGEVSIELQMRDGAVHASFLTGSKELREALQHGWSQLASRSESAGMPLAEPVFKAPATASTNAGQQEFRERRQEPPPQEQAAQAFYPTPQQPKRPGQPVIPGRPSTTGLNLWA